MMSTTQPVGAAELRFHSWIVKPLDPIRLRKATTALLDGRTFHDESFQPVPVLAVLSTAGAGADATGATG